MSAIPLIPAAEYLRVSTEHQQYSLEFQTAMIRSYAMQHNFLVVQTYTDEGRSGLVLRHREALAQLLHDVVAGGQPYRVILVYDISRWGRFQDADESAYYEFLCKQAGSPIHYCAETFSNDATMPNAIMKALKRVMAAEFSRELSDKTTLAMTRLVKEGLWAGSSPGYGLRRMLVSGDRKPKELMGVGEQKYLRRDHTVLVPGPPDEIRVIKEIFRLYIKEKRSMPFIARKLNGLGILHGSVRWTYQAIRLILFSEKYTGSMVWGRYTQKLRSRCVSVPKEKWVVARDVFEPVVDRKTYDAARTVWANRTKQFSDEQYLNALRALLGGC
jgi:DNA invertase Pin-like site-specific DNA recombinase